MALSSGPPGARHASVPLLLLLALPPQQTPQPPPPSGVVIRRAAAAPASIGVGAVAYLSPPDAAALGQILLTEAPGYRTPVHIHHRTDETFHVLEGRLTLYVDGQAHELTAGDHAFIPRAVPHAQGNTGEAPTRVLLTVAPGAFTGFFRAREAIVKTAPPDHPDYGPRMRALGETWDIETVGPPAF